MHICGQSFFIHLFNASLDAALRNLISGFLGVRRTLYVCRSRVPTQEKYEREAKEGGKEKKVKGGKRRKGGEVRECSIAVPSPISDPGCAIAPTLFIVWLL